MARRMRYPRRLFRLNRSYTGRRGNALPCIVNTPLCHLERRRNPRRSEALTKTPRACRSVNGKDLCETVYARPPNISNIMFGFSLALIHRRFRSLPRAFFSLNTVEKSSTSCRIFILPPAIFTFCTPLRMTHRGEILVKTFIIAGRRGRRPLRFYVFLPT